MARAKREFLVVLVEAPDMWRIVAGGMGTTEEADAWVRKHGEDGAAYRCPSVPADVLSVSVKRVEKRTVKRVDALPRTEVN